MMLKNLAIAAASVVCENSPWCQAGLTGFSGISLAAGGGGPLLELYTHTILVRTRVILTAAS